MEQKREKPNCISVIAITLALILSALALYVNVNEDFIPQIKESAEETAENVLLRFGPEVIRKKIKEKRFDEGMEELYEKYGIDGPGVAILRVGEHRYEIDATGNILREVDATGNIIREVFDEE